MSERARELTDEERERSLALIQAVEARMRQAETFTWAVPGLALTGQAFLLTIALDRERASEVRGIAAGAGIVLLLAALHFLGKHTFNFDWFEAVLEREREKLGYDRLTRSVLLSDIESFPKNTHASPARMVERKLMLRQREWWRDEHRKRRANWLYRPWAKARNLLVVQMKAVWVWGGALTALLGLDAYLLVDAI